jgi:predicted Zn-dependent protease
MSQEVSVSYQAIKSKVYKLIDAAVEGEKTEAQVLESLERWWRQVHPADRAVAQKYLLRVLERSHASLNAMTHALLEATETPAPLPEKLDKPVGTHSGVAGPLF